MATNYPDDSVEVSMLSEVDSAVFFCLFGFPVTPTVVPVDVGDLPGFVYACPFDFDTLDEVSLVKLLHVWHGLGLAPRWSLGFVPRYHIVAI